MKDKLYYLCDSNYNFDSRIQKELVSLKKFFNEVILVCWNREKTKSNIINKYYINNIEIKRIEICSKGKYGGGIFNLFSLILFEIKLFFVLNKILKAEDTIHACNLPCGLIALILKIKKKVKYVYDIFDFYCDSHFNNEKSLLYKIIRNLEIKVINNSNVTILCSEKRKKQIFGSFPQKLTIIHNSPNEIKEENYSNERYKVKKNDKIKICYVGIIDENRPIILLARVISKIKDIEFHCGGFGKEEEIMKKLANENENIYFYGKMSYKDVIYLEKQCDILPALYSPTLKNHKYAAPNKFYEALMLGKPIIALKDTGIDEMIKKYNLGIVCKETEKELLEGLNILIKQIKNKEINTNKFQALFKENFSWNIMEERLKSLYEEL